MHDSFEGVRINQIPELMRSGLARLLYMEIQLVDYTELQYSTLLCAPKFFGRNGEHCTTPNNYQR